MPDFNKFKEALNSNVNSKENALDENRQLKERYTINGVPDVVSKTFEQSFTTSPEVLGKLLDEGINVTINRTNIDIEEEQNEIRKAIEQGALSKIFNSLEQIVVSEVILGTFKGFTDLFDAFVNVFQKGDNDYTSAASSFFEDLQNKNREAFAIYKENPYKTFDFGDVGWWADNLVSVGSTISLLIPARGVTGVLGKVGSAIRATGKTRKALSAMSKTNKGRELIEKGGTIGRLLKYPNYYGRKASNFTELASTAIMSRIAENYQEAHDVYKDSYDKIINNLSKMGEVDRKVFFERNPSLWGKSDEEIAKKLSSEVATNTFWGDMPLVLMDFIQYKGVESALKGGAKQITTASIEKAQKNALKRLALGQSAEEALNIETKGFFKKIGENALNTGKSIIKHPGRTVEALELSEGFEEGWQGIVSAYNKDLIDSYLDGKHSTRTWDSYLTDGEVWEQAFWGAVGGIVFQKGAKGFNKLYTKYKAKKALNEKEITDDQYQMIIRSQDEARILEINSRQASIDKLIQDLTKIQNGEDPRINNEGVTKKIETAQEREEIQNEVIDDWVLNFTLDAIDAGNFELLSEFINTDVFDKYINKENLNINNINGRSLKNRIQDIYERYSINTESLIKNSSALDYQTIRAAARKLTRDDISIVRIQDNINKMRENLEQLNGYHPSSVYEQIRKMDGLLERYKRLEVFEKELEEERNKKNISKSGYDVEKNRILEYKNSILNQLIDVSPENFKEDFKSGDSNVIKGILDNYKKDVDFNKEWVSTPKEIKQAIDEILLLEMEKDDTISFSPKTQEDFENIYNTFNIAMNNTFNKRVQNAIDVVRDYLLNAENIDSAVKNAMDEKFEDVSNPITKHKLKKAMSVLKIGSHSNADLTKMFNEEVESIKKERENRNIRDSKGIQDGKEIETNILHESPNPSDEFSKNDIVKEENEIENKKENIEEKDINKETKTPIKETDEYYGVEEEEIDNTITDEENERLKIEAEQFKENETIGVDDELDKYLASTFEDSFHYKTEEDIKKEIRSAFINVARLRPDLFNKMVNDGVGSTSYNNFINASLSVLIKGITYRKEELLPYVKQQLSIYLSSIVARKQISKEQEAGVFSLINDLNKLITKELVKENFSAIDFISEEEYNKNMENFLNRYFNLSGKVKFETKNGIKLINLNNIFEDLIRLSEEGIYSFEELAEIVNNIFNYANNYNGTKYRFVSDGILNGYFSKENTLAAKLNNLSKFIDELYAKRTSTKTIIDDNMHFAISNNFKTKEEKAIAIRKARNKQLKIEYNVVGGIKTISLYYIDNGNKVELGFLNTVIQGSKDNKTLKMEHPNGIITGVTINDGKYHIEDNRIEEILFDIIDGFEETEDTDKRKAAMFLFNRYMYPLTKKWYYDTTNEDIDNFLSNPLIKELLDRITFKLPIGQTYNTSSGITKKANIKVTAENIKNLNDNDKRVAIRKLVTAINGIIFYPYYDNYSLNHPESIDIKTDVLRSGLNNYIKKVYDNYLETRTYQQALDSGNENNLELSVVSSDTSYLNFDRDNQKDISNIGIKGSVSAHPYVAVYGGEIHVEGISKTYPNKPNFKEGTAGILLEARAGYPMIAMLTNSNDITKEHIDAIKKEYDKLLKIYYSSSGGDIVEAYNNLYNFFNALLGKYSLFSGWKIISSDNDFTICKPKEQNPKEYTILAQFYKYKVAYDSNTKTFKSAGRVISEKDLNKHYGHIINYKGKNNEGELVTKRISLYNEIQLNYLFEDIIKELKYNKSFVGVHPDAKNDMVLIDDNGFTVKIGEYVKTYKNYTDFIVKNNCFKTTHVGTRINNVYAESSREISSVYVKYSGFKEYLTDKDKRLKQGFAANLVEQNIKSGDEMTAKDVMLNAGYSEEEFKEYNDIFTALMPKSIIIDFTDKEDVYAGFKDGKIRIYKKGITFITSDKRHAPRLLIHENVHRVIEEKGFFTSEKYGLARTAAIIDTWDEFVNSSKNNPDLINFIKDFTEKYGNLKTSKDFKDRALFANEWIAEVLSNKNLAEYLNNIDYNGNIKIVQGSKRKSILQIILDLIIDLFEGLKTINKNTLLDQFYKSVGNPIITTINQEVNNSINEQQTSETFVEKTEDYQQETINNVEETESYKETTIDDYYDSDNYISPDEDIEDYDSSDFEWNDNELNSKIDMLPEEIRVSSYLEDTKNNPYGMSFAKNMDDWIKQTEPHNRAVMVSQMASGALEYICQ